jgi:hypothetical protein
LKTAYEHQRGSAAGSPTVDCSTYSWDGVWLLNPLDQEANSKPDE